MIDYRAISGAHKDSTAKLILSIAAQASSTVDELSNWLAIGLSAVLALIVSNIDKLKDFLDIGMVKIAVLLYIISLLLVLAQKRIAITIRSSKNGDSIARELLAAGGSAAFDPDFTIDQIIISTLQPKKRFVIKKFEKIRAKRIEGDTVWHARDIARKAQRQDWIVYTQGVLTICVVCVLAAAIK